MHFNKVDLPAPLGLPRRVDRPLLSQKKHWKILGAPQMIFQGLSFECVPFTTSNHLPFIIPQLPGPTSTSLQNLLIFCYDEIICPITEYLLIWVPFVFAAGLDYP